jgi:opacity protein-like surface antigen
MGVDFSELIEDELDGDDTNATKFLVALGGGVTVRPSRSLAVDLGFRYTRIATEDPVINSSMAYGAVKVGF